MGRTSVEATREHSHPLPLHDLRKSIEYLLNHTESPTASPDGNPANPIKVKCCDASPSTTKRSGQFDSTHTSHISHSHSHSHSRSLPSHHNGFIPSRGNTGNIICSQEVDQIDCSALGRQEHLISEKFHSSYFYHNFRNTLSTKTPFRSPKSHSAGSMEQSHRPVAVIACQSSMMNFPQMCGGEEQDLVSKAVAHQPQSASSEMGTPGVGDFRYEYHSPRT
jgi:hypothetical protein